MTSLVLLENQIQKIDEASDAAHDLEYTLSCIQGCLEDVHDDYAVTLEEARDLDRYRELGTVKEVQDLFDKLNQYHKDLEVYRAIGSVEQVQEAMTRMQAPVQRQPELSAQDAMELEQYRTLGTVKELRGACRMADALKELLHAWEA